MKRFLPILGLLAFAGCTASAADVARSDARAAADRAKLDRALRGYVAGPPENCLPGIDRRIAETTQIGSTILYRVGSSRLYRNDMNGTCPVGRQDAILVTQTPTGDLCRGDIVQLLDRTSRFPMGSCGYGDFIPYRRAR